MGVVYRARQLNLNRPVALKMLRSGRLASPQERARFIREAEAAARVRSTNIVQIYDVGEAEGHPYFTMELVDGGTLAERLKGAPQPGLAAASLVATLAGAVEVAHRNGIVHRDLKPANILLSADDTPKISDFGIARPMEGGPSVTLPGDWMGTPSYMAPEQAIGGAGAGCPPVDVYSLGAILYEALTGRPPFKAATTAETHRQLIDDEPVPPSRLVTKVARDLETICLKCLNKNPQRRYATAAALANDLLAFTRGDPIAARPDRWWERGVRWVRRRPAATALALAGLVLAGVGIGVIVRESALAAERRLALQSWGTRLEFVQRLQHQGRFQDARAILDRVPDEGSEELRRKIERAQVDLSLVERFDGIRMNRAVPTAATEFNDLAASDASYLAAFIDAGLWKPEESTRQIAARVAATEFRAAALAAMDDWALCANDLGRKRLILEVARLADPDPWRDRVRDLQTWGDSSALVALSREARIREQSVQLLVALAGLLEAGNADPIPFLRKVQRAHPTDFWTNFTLAEMLDDRRMADAVGFYRTAVALRPQTVAARVNLGFALIHQDRMPEAIETWEQALEVSPDSLTLHYNLAAAYFNAGRHDRAGEHAREVLRASPRHGIANDILGHQLLLEGRIDEARTHLQTAVAVLSKDDPMLGSSKAALAECDRYLALEPRIPAVLSGRGDATPDDLARMGDLCRWKGSHATAARLYERALAGDLGEERRASILYYEACSAILASEIRSGEARAPSVEDLAAWRSQALASLRGCITSWTEHLADGTASAREAVRQDIDRWLAAPELSSVRDQKALESRPADERVAWDRVWSDVRNLRAQAK